MVDICDIDQNGSPEIIVGGLDGKFRVLTYNDLSQTCSATYLKDIRGVSLTIPSGRSAPAMKDVTSDGIADFISGDSDGGLSLYLTGMLRQSRLDYHPIDFSETTVSWSRSRPFVADYNKNGMADILLGTAGGEVYLLSAEPPNNPAVQFRLVFVDLDRDGLPDEWEQQIIDADMNDAIDDIFDVHQGDDFDQDWLLNRDEYLLGTDPCNSDSDGDGLSDGVEVLSSDTDPLSEDTDKDGLSDFDEIVLYPTDPTDSDSDGDGMPDGWEIENHQNPASDDRSDDPDGDGYSTGKEYILGTDPEDPNSTLQTRIGPAGTEGIQVSWMSVAGRYYDVMYCDRLSGEWYLLSNNIPGTDGMITVLDASSPKKARYYRINVHLEQQTTYILRLMAPDDCGISAPTLLESGKSYLIDLSTACYVTDVAVNGVSMGVLTELLLHDVSGNYTIRILCDE